LRAAMRMLALCVPSTMMTRPVLYSFRRCPYALRARLALLASATICEIREVKLYAKPAALLAASPKATVPVLLLSDGSVIDESLDIMHWALGAHDPDQWLERNDAALIAANDGAFKYHLDRYKYPDRHGTDSAAHRAAAMIFLAGLEARLSVTQYLSGHTSGLSDAAILPFVRQFALTDQPWFGAQPLPKLQAWLDRQLACSLFEAAMMRLQPWQARDLPILLCSQH
jgi:glutathione S-transferase